MQYKITLAVCIACVVKCICTHAIGPDVQHQTQKDQEEQWSDPVYGRSKAMLVLLLQMTSKGDAAFWQSGP